MNTIENKSKINWDRWEAHCERCDRYDTYVNGDYFQVYDNKEEKYIGKKFKYPSCADRFRETLIFI
tara:strand:- start:915 stop:1112 length:198 start_codon:yes stop_codon:yes gene_type:complete